MRPRWRTRVQSGHGPATLESVTSSPEVSCGGEVAVQDGQHHADPAGAARRDPEQLRRGRLGAGFDHRRGVEAARFPRRRPAAELPGDLQGARLTTGPAPSPEPPTVSPIRIKNRDKRRSPVAQLLRLASWNALGSVHHPQHGSHRIVVDTLRYYLTLLAASSSAGFASVIGTSPSSAAAE